MEIDRFIRRNEPHWIELAALTERIRRRRLLDAAELDRAVDLYQQISTHLSYARTWYGDSEITGRLTGLVGEARSVVYGSGDRGANVVLRFFRDEFPRATWRNRTFSAIAAGLMMVPAIYVGIWMTFSDAALEASAPDALRRAAYVEEEFEAYYSSAPAAEFSTEVLINNIQVSFLAYALGALATVGTVVVLIYNGVVLGEAGGLFHAAGEQTKFWGLILPHGLLELTAIFVAGGAGLRLGWAMIRPGDRTRGRAVADEGRESVPIIIGLILVFVVAGTIEGFVTPSALPTVARVGIGVAAEAAFLTYVVGFGRRAETVDEASGYSRPVDLMRR